MTVEEFILNYKLQEHFVISVEGVEKRQGWQRNFSSSDGIYHGLIIVNEDKSNFWFSIYKEWNGQELLNKIISNRFEDFLPMIQMLEKKYIKLCQK